MADKEEVERMRQAFNKEIERFFGDRQTKPEWDRRRIQEVMHIIEQFKSDPLTRESSHYYYRNKYKIEEIDGKKILTYNININVQSEQQPMQIIQIIPSEEYFDTIYDAHLKTSHGGRDKMFKYLRDRVYIPRTITSLFPKHCMECKKSYNRKMVKPLNNSDYKRGFFDLIDMSNSPDYNYKYILFYQDQSTKYTIMRPLTTNDASSDVAEELLRIFLDFGGPAILRSTEPLEFTENVVKRLRAMWSECVILVGRPIKPDDYDSYQVKGKVLNWMKQHNSTKWTRGARFVALELNSTYNTAVENTPCKSLFGMPPKLGLDTKGMPPETIASLIDEEDLDKYMLEKESQAKKRLKRKVDRKTTKDPNEEIQQHNMSESNDELVTPDSKKPEEKVDVDESMESSSKKIKDEDDELCWVCCNYEGVTFSCDLCNGPIHESCGVYKDISRKILKCNVCIENQKGNTVEIELKPMVTSHVANEDDSIIIVKHEIPDDDPLIIGK